MIINFDRLLLLGIVVFLAILFFTHSCGDESQENKNQLNQIFEQNKKDISAINKNILSIKTEVEEIKKEIDSLDVTNEKTIERFNYEISKMDEVFRTSADTLIVNAYLRCWTERLYRLPGFFQSTADDSGAADDSKDPSSGRELLSPD